MPEKVFLPNEGIVTPNHRTRWWPLYVDKIKGDCVTLQRYDYTADTRGGDHASWIVTKKELEENYTGYSKSIIITCWVDMMDKNPNLPYNTHFSCRDKNACGWDLYRYKINGFEVVCTFEQSKLYGSHLRQWMIDGSIDSKHCYETAAGLQGERILNCCSNGLAAPTIEKQCMVYDSFLLALRFKETDMFIEHGTYWVTPYSLHEYFKKYPGNNI